MKSSTYYVYALIVLLLTSSCSPSITPTVASSIHPATSAPTNAQSTFVPTIVQSTLQPSMQQPPTMNLSISDLNSTTPQGILDEVNVFGGMGGPDDPCLGDNYDSPHYPTPILLKSHFQNPNRIGYVELYACGLAAVDETVNVQVELPDNTIRSYQVVSIPYFDQNINQYPGQQYEVVMNYQIEYSDPVGNYHFVFKGNNWSLDEYVTVSDVSYPSFIYDNNQLFLRFSPNEKVRIFVYRSSDCPGWCAELIGWKDFQVDSKGLLIVYTDQLDYFYAAVGEVAGEVALSVRDVRSLFGISSIIEPLDPPATTSTIVCSGTKPSRLQIGMSAEVTRSGMAPQLSLRELPSLSAQKLHVIAAGRKMTILKGPECADGSYWWYVRSEQGFEGWAREGDNEDYWIDPLP